MTYDKHRFCSLTRGEGGANQCPVGGNFIGDGVLKFHVIAHGGDIQRNLINAIRRGVRDHRIAPAVGFDALVVEHGDMAGARGFHQNIGVPERLAQRQTILMQHRSAAHPVAEVAGVTGVAVAQVIVSPRALVLQRGIAAVVLLRAVALVDAIEKILLPRQITTDTGTGGGASGIRMGSGKTETGRQRRITQRHRQGQREDIVFLVVVQARATLGADAKRQVTKRRVPRELQTLRGF